MISSSGLLRLSSLFSSISSFWFYKCCSLLLATFLAEAALRLSYAALRFKSFCCFCTSRASSIARYFFWSSFIYFLWSAIWYCFLFWLWALSVPKTRSEPRPRFAPIPAWLVLGSKLSSRAGSGCYCELQHFNYDKRIVRSNSLL